MLVTSDRQYAFAVTPDELWSSFNRTDEYQRWWPWLTRFESDGFQRRQCWTCRVQPPIPYSVSFTIELTDVVEERSVAAKIDGDITGWAGVDITPTERGCDVQFHSELAPANPLLRAVAVAARPVVAFGHDWVLDTGFRQFRTHALSDHAARSRVVPHPES